jgi:hypothetical protein
MTGRLPENLRKFFASTFLLLLLGENTRSEQAVHKTP